MPDGFLRDSVLVAEADDYVTLSHPCWTLELPRQWAEQTAGIMDFLRRRRPLGSHDNTEAADLARLLSAQGCLTVSEESASYSLREVHALFHGIRNEWCGHYYRHPLWEMLRAGELPRPRFIAWAVYNYFLSRSAGISASRFVAFSERTGMRGALARSMIEEYSHFSDYYHIRHSALSIPQREIEEYVPLPSSTAFCHQMLRMAEEDWLGHVLIAYFQESTVQFHRECFDFYSQVEASYGLKDFFKPWRDHIQVDIDCLHAESIEELFDSDERIAIADLRRSLTNAWFAYRSLLTALDEIAYGVAVVDGEWRRRPIQRTLADLADGILLPQRRALDPASMAASDTLLALADQAAGVGVTVLADDRAGRNEKDERFLREDTLRSAYRALSFADEAALILALGKLAEDAQSAPTEVNSPLEPELPVTAEAMAIANFLRELAVAPLQFCFAVYSLAAADGAAGGRQWLPVSDPARSRLAELLARKADAAAGPMLTKLVQLLELVARWKGRTDLQPTPNFFTGFGLGVSPPSISSA